MRAVTKRQNQVPSRVSNAHLFSFSGLRLLKTNRCGIGVNSILTRPKGWARIRAPWSPFTDHDNTYSDNHILLNRKVRYVDTSHDGDPTEQDQPLLSLLVIGSRLLLVGLLIGESYVVRHFSC